MSLLLLLKLLLAPGLIGIAGLIAQRSGHAAAGRFAGLPIVVGPVLVLLTVEQGEAFGMRAAIGALSAVPAAVAFALAYARSAPRFGVLASLGVALAVWASLIALLFAVPLSFVESLGLALAAVIAGPFLLPRDSEPVKTSGSTRLLPRMLAAAALTLAVTALASVVGPDASGMLALFPLATTVLALSTHLEAGPLPVRALLRNLVGGMLAVVAFCTVLIFTLPRGSLALAVVAAVAAAALAQWLLAALSLARAPRGA